MWTVIIIQCQYIPLSQDINQNHTLFSTLKFKNAKNNTINEMLEYVTQNIHTVC